MARRPDFGKREDMMSEKDLKALGENLSQLSRPVSWTSANGRTATAGS
jgi:hypothetical protein